MACFLLLYSSQVLCVYGGAPYESQEGALRRGVDVVIGTPGRIKDLLNRGTLKLTEIRCGSGAAAEEMLQCFFCSACDGRTLKI